MAFPNLRDALLSTARDDFPTFYAGASAQETRLMDMAILLAALFIRLNQAQGQKPPTASWAEESGAAKTIFSEIRKTLTKSPTFKKLPVLERQKIQCALFDRLS